MQVLFVGLAAAPFSIFAPRPPMTGEVVIVILFTAVVTTALAFAALLWAQARVSGSLTSIIWDHEPLTISFVIGALLILTAMIVPQTSATIQTDGPNPRHE